MNSTPPELIKQFKKGDWVLVRNGKKAHKLIQGYNGLVPRCTPMRHSIGLTYSVHVDQEDMRDGTNSEKCKRCAG